jgi:glycosyltransferase involved in cell wall biosynthesis
VSAVPHARNSTLTTSVLVPVYNGERWLAECLRSIVGQSRRPEEILVLDDGSTDRTPEIVRSFGTAVRHERSATNLGQFANVNRGIALARGDLVAVFHADDVYDPEILEAATDALLSHPEAGAVFCKDRFIDGEGREYARLELPAALRGGRVLEYAQVLENLLLHMNRFLRTPGAVVRREVYRRVGGFRTDLGSAADYEMWLRVACEAPIVLLDRHLYAYRHTRESEGASYQASRTEPDLFFAITQEHLDRGARALVSPEALAAFRAHLAEDHLLLAARAYAAGRRQQVAPWLRRASLRAIAASPHVRRMRLLAVAAALWGLQTLPTLPPVQRLFAGRWGT